MAGVLLPIFRKWLKKLQRRCQRGQAVQEKGIEMREMGVEVGEDKGDRRMCMRTKEFISLPLS